MRELWAFGRLQVEWKIAPFLSWLIPYNSFNGSRVWLALPDEANVHLLIGDDQWPCSEWKAYAEFLLRLPESGKFRHRSNGHPEWGDSQGNILAVFDIRERKVKLTASIIYRCHSVWFPADDLHVNISEERIRMLSPLTNTLLQVLNRGPVNPIIIYDIATERPI